MCARPHPPCMGLGRADSQSHQVFATGNGARVLHPFAVPRGHGACCAIPAVRCLLLRRRYWGRLYLVRRGACMGLGRADSQSHQVRPETGRGYFIPRNGACAPTCGVCAPPPVLGPVVSGARLSLSTGPTPQAPPDARSIQMHQTPWLFATSLPHHRDAGARIKRICAQRMQIEENIHDLWSHRFGFAQRYTRTKRPEPSESRRDRLREMTLHTANLHGAASNISLSGKFACQSIVRPCRTQPLFGQTQTGGTRV